MNLENAYVGVLGATSLVGQALLPLLVKGGREVIAFSRSQQPPSNAASVQWRTFSKSGLSQRVSQQQADSAISDWICAAPIWVLPEHFSMLEAHGARRIVAISSTSRFTKSESTSDEEKETASKLTEAEDRLEKWAKQKEIEWIILRPTLIYGLGRDKNISELIRLIRRFGFFPLPGEAKGLRQPVHAIDVAAACLTALGNKDIANCAYNLSGGETLTYREMVSRIFISLGLRPRLIVIPLKLLYLVQALLSLMPRYHRWNMAMVARMNADLVFDHAEAARDLNFSPRKFHLAPEDLPNQ